MQKKRPKETEPSSHLILQTIGGHRYLLLTSRALWPTSLSHSRGNRCGVYRFLGPLQAITLVDHQIRRLGWNLDAPSPLVESG